MRTSDRLAYVSSLNDKIIDNRNAIKFIVQTPPDDSQLDHLLAEELDLREQLTLNLHNQQRVLEVK